MKIVLKLFNIVGLIALIGGQDYDHTNQALWNDMDAECHLKKQSPIELNQFGASPGFGFPLLKLKNFNIPLSKPAKLLNNGHTADIQLPSNNSVFITGGPLLYNKYRAESLHFHWGSKDFHGCEHYVDGHRCSLELHIVHRNSKYNTLNEATLHPDGLCVLAILFDVNPNQQQNFNGLNLIVDSLNQIFEYNSSTELNNLVLRELLAGINIQKFFTYPGSLTTPPCSQAVTWIVFPQRIKISLKQIERFRLLKDINDDFLLNNYRFLQAKGNRKVIFHF